MAPRRTIAAFALLALAALLLPPQPALAADTPFPPAKRAALDAALAKSFAATKAPGVVVGMPD